MPKAKPVTPTTDPVLGDVIVLLCTSRWCDCRAQVILLSPGPGMVTATYCGNEAPFEADVPATDYAGVWCIAHRHYLVAKPIRAVRTSTACSHACEHSTAKDCRCSCGGINHGAAA